MDPTKKAPAALRGTTLVALVLLAVASSGCRGTTSSKPPIHVSPNMDSQEKFEAQEINTFFPDARAMRAPVAGTVARGHLDADTRLYEGRNADGTLVTQNPLEVTRALMLRGQQRFDIYCEPCHGLAGDGQGVIVRGNYGLVPPPTYHSDAMRAQADGHFFEVISKGIRTMPSYAQQIPVEDRWAIVAYIRALQRSQHASAQDVPESER
jgi:mono/diheme cytochrome c family protein